MATRNDAKVRETTCGYAKVVDGVNTPQPRSGMPRSHQSALLQGDLSGTASGYIAMVIGNGMTIEASAQLSS
jgi:hypothetical protein